MRRGGNGKWKIYKAEPSAMEVKIEKCLHLMDWEFDEEENSGGGFMYYVANFHVIT